MEFIMWYILTYFYFPHSAVSNHRPQLMMHRAKRSLMSWVVVIPKEGRVRPLIYIFLFPTQCCVKSITPAPIPGGGVGQAVTYYKCDDGKCKWAGHTSSKGTLTIFYGWQFLRWAKIRPERKKNWPFSFFFYFVLRHDINLPFKYTLFLIKAC